MKNFIFTNTGYFLQYCKFPIYLVLPFLVLGFAGSSNGVIDNSIKNLPATLIKIETNVDRGRIIFNRCRSCHNLKKSKDNKIGPHLEGLFGRKTASVIDFSYSVALKQANFLWTANKLNLWLKNPNAFLPGNRMAYAGLLPEQDREDLIAYLKQATEMDDTP